MDDSAELPARLQAVEPRARLVSARWLRRIVRRHRDLSASARPAPHEHCYWITRAELVQIAELGELSLDGELPELLLLLPRADDGDAVPEIEAYWRQLFHAGIDRAFDDYLNPRTLDDLRRSLGGTLWQEIREVISGSRLIFDRATDHDYFREFTAFFFELKYFQPDRLKSFFPGVHDPESLEKRFAEFFSVRGLFDKLRPAGAEIGAIASPHGHGGTAVDAVGHRAAASTSEPPRLSGNDVRAAIAAFKAGNLPEAEAQLRNLAGRLAKALGSPAGSEREWEAALRPLLGASGRRFWPQELRLLYDLQKACVDSERELYAVELAEWVVTLGRKPIKRKLDKPRELNLLRHLRKAEKRLDHCGIDANDRLTLINLLHRETRATENRIRTEFRPILLQAMDEVGIEPANVPEKVARNKIAEELLDSICERGFFRMGDVRDAIARNRLKLDDIGGPVSFLAGDALLKINRKLPFVLDGVYRRGEIYLRLMQRFSSLLFGTAIGRLFTLFIALPFGGAYITLEAVHHLFEAVEGGIHSLSGHNAHLNAIGELAGGAARTFAKDPSFGTHTLATLPAIVVLGVFYLLIMHWPMFRGLVAQGLKKALVDLPRVISRSPLVHAIFDNRIVRFFMRFLLIPVLVGTTTALLLGLIFHFEWLYCWIVGGGAALFTASFFRTTAGRDMEERFNDTVARAWHVISASVIAGLFHAIISFFRAALELIEKCIYAIDEMLRFREGDSQLSFYFKLVFGTVWFLVSYFLRFVINLLIEPQINPIKHFPVVTVSHKLLLPMIPNLSSAFGWSIPSTTTVVGLIPGIFGFLVWEFKENWKLYRANRPRRLVAVPVGSHGEKIIGLLRPGFHSGAVPKAYAKMRRAFARGDDSAVHRAEHVLHHVEECLQHLVERDFLAYLRISHRWGGQSIRLHDIEMGTNRVRFSFVVGREHRELACVIEQRNGWIIAHFEGSAELHGLNPKQQAAFLDAVASLYKLCGVHLVREQLAVVFGPLGHNADCDLESIIVPTPTGNLVYNYGTRPELMPADASLPEAKPLARGRVLFNEAELSWERWVERWEKDIAGEAPLAPLLPGMALVG